MVLPTSHKVPRVSWYSGYCSLRMDFGYGAFTLSGWLSQNHSPIQSAHLPQSMTPACTHAGLGSSHFARRYSGNRCFFLFLRVLRCFSSPGYPLIGYVFTYGYLSITLSAFPHSEICGLTDICSFPQLIAACHVLLRLLVPRHPPCALCYLTSSKLPSLCSQQSLRISAHARRIISPLK